MKNFRISNPFLINFIIASIVPLLILGPFFPDLIVSISSLIFLFYVFKNNNFYYFNNTPFIVFISFCVIAIICSIQAENIPFSIKSSLFYLRIGVFSCLIWYLIDKNESILVFFYYALVLSFSILVLDGYLQYFTGENILGFKIINNRVSSFFGDELILGSYLSRLFPLLFALFLIKKKKKFEIYFISLLFILVDILIFISGERTAFLFLNLSTVFIIILIKEYQKFRIATFIIALFGIFIINSNSPIINETMFKIPAKNMGIIKSNEKPTIFSKAHDSHYKSAYKMFNDKPILGHGPKMFRLLCHDQKYKINKYSCTTHPHNFYIQLLAETGIIGFFFLFSALFYVLITALRQFISIILKKKRYLNDYQVCLLSGILITVWPLSPNGNFFNNWLIIVYGLPVGFYLQSLHLKKG